MERCDGAESLGPFAIAWADSIGIDDIDHHAVLELVPGPLLLLLNILILDVLLKVNMKGNRLSWVKYTHCSCLSMSVTGNTLWNWKEEPMSSKVLIICVYFLLTTFIKVMKKEIVWHSSSA